jgi:NADH-quinone oxidoreductase subunit K
MAEVPLLHGLLLAAGLFALGLLTVLVRRNIAFMLMGLVAMLNAAGLALVLGGARWGGADGQVLFLLALIVAMALAATGAALTLRMLRQRGSLDVAALTGRRR